MPAPRRYDPIADLERRQRALATRSPGVRVNARGTGRTRYWQKMTLRPPVTGDLRYRVTNDTLIVQTFSNVLSMTDFWAKYPGRKALQQPIARIGPQARPARVAVVPAFQREFFGTTATGTWSGPFEILFLIDYDGYIYYLSGPRTAGVSLNANVSLG